jgi:hypothetical protein
LPALADCNLIIAEVSGDSVLTHVSRGFFGFPSTCLNQTWNFVNALFLKHSAEVSAYSGWQKYVPLFERFFLQPFILPFRVSKFIFRKRYNSANLFFPFPCHLVAESITDLKIARLPGCI